MFLRTCVNITAFFVNFIKQLFNKKFVLFKNKM